MTTSTDSVSAPSRARGAGARWAAATLIVLALLALWAFLGPKAAPGGPTSAAPAAAPVEAEEPVTTATAATERAAGYPATLGRLEDRIGWLDRRSAAREDDWATLEELAAAHVQHAQLTGDYESYRRAERALVRAFAQAPEGSGPHLARARLHYTIHRFDDIEADLAAAERYRIPTSIQRRAIAKLRADLARERGDYDASRAAFEELATARRTGDVVLGLAQHAWQTGALDEAAALLAEAEGLGRGGEPLSRAHACLARGLLELDRARWDDALAHYRRGLVHLPGYWVLEEHIAEATASRGDLTEARALYEELVERTANPELMDALAGVLDALEETDAASAMRARAHEGHEARLAILPEAAFGHALDHYLEHEGDAERAVELAARNRDLRPNGKSLTTLAQAYVRAGRLEDALAVVATLRASAFRSADGHATAALVLELAGQRDEAAAERGRAEALASGAADGLAWLADAYRARQP